MPALNNIGSKIEAAAALVAADTTFTGTPAIYKGRDDENRVAPCIIFQCDSGTESHVGLGNYTVQLSGIVKSLVADGETNHNNRTAELHDLMSDDLAALLTAKKSNVGGLHVFGATTMSFDSSIDGDMLVETVTRTLYAAPKTLS